MPFRESETERENPHPPPSGSNNLTSLGYGHPEESFAQHTRTTFTPQKPLPKNLTALILQLQLLHLSSSLGLYFVVVVVVITDPQPTHSLSIPNILPRTTFHYTPLWRRSTCMTTTFLCRFARLSCVVAVANAAIYYTCRWHPISLAEYNNNGVWCAVGIYWNGQMNELWCCAGCAMVLSCRCFCYTLRYNTYRRAYALFSFTLFASPHFAPLSLYMHLSFALCVFVNEGESERVCVYFCVQIEPYNFATPQCII